MEIAFLPKSTPRRSKIVVWRGFRWRSLFDPNFFRSWLVLGLLLGASWGAPEPSWSVLGASRGRLGPVLGASSAVLGASSSILCSSWGVLWILCGKAFENHRFYVRISNPEPLKIKPPLQREHDLRDFEIFENNLPFGSILVPTWLHFGSIFRVLGRLGGLLGRLGGVLGRLGALLGASWRILARLGASWGVLEASWMKK